MSEVQAEGVRVQAVKVVGDEAVNGFFEYVIIAVLVLGLIAVTYRKIRGLRCPRCGGRLAKDGSVQVRVDASGFIAGLIGLYTLGAVDLSRYEDRPYDVFKCRSCARRWREDHVRAGELIQVGSEAVGSASGAQGGESTGEPAEAKGYVSHADCDRDDGGLGAARQE